MKLLSYQHNDIDSYGAVVPDGVLDLKQFLREKAPDLKSLLGNGLLDQARDLANMHRATFPLDAVRFDPVIPNPGKIVCVGLNYHEHVRETGRTLTEVPTLFLRVADSQVGHGQDMVRPRESSRFDYEGEIAVIIGKPGRRIAETDAWSHIAGYACYNDGSIRDWQNATTQWTPGKNFWRTGAFGPWMVTADDIKPGQVMTLVTRLNGQEMQRATTDMMIHSIPRQIAYVSSFVPLAAGDVIVTGTPGGVGNKRTPPVFMKPGDAVEVEVDAVGVLRNTIRDD